MTEPSDDWIERVLAPLVDARVKKAVARHLVDASHLKPYDLIEMPRIHDNERTLHLHETGIMNDALINLSSGEITLEEYVFFGDGVSVARANHAFGTHRSLGECKRFRGDRCTSPASQRGCRLGRPASRRR
jgi:hypothetical protein